MDLDDLEQRAREERDWPLEPPTAEEGAELKRIAGWFGAGVVGTSVGLAALLPNLVEARGATRGLAFNRELRARCLETGLTPEELLEQDAQLADGTLSEAPSATE